MLCSVCRRQLDRQAASCPSCGALRSGGGSVFELVLPDRTAVPIVRELTIGRAPGNTVQLVDPSVSRVHARVTREGRTGLPAMRDEHSSHGTWVDGHRLASPVALRDGSRVRIGDQDLVVRRRRSDGEAGHTLLVPPGTTVVVAQRGDPQQVVPTELGLRPRLRSGYALKRLEAGEGTRRWVLNDLVAGRIVRLRDGDARFLGLLDGRHSIPELVDAAERELGRGGPARLALLLAELGAQGLLADAPAADRSDLPASGLGRVFRPRRRAWAGAATALDRVYSAGGWRLFTRPALGAVGLTAAAGLAAFCWLIARRYGTPFVVGHRLALGGLVFFLGRLAVVVVHELAHGLTLASFGRRVGEAGVKLVLVFPYAFVDTSNAWFEPRRRRIAVSAAGPVSDLALGGAFSLCCAGLPAGAARDVFFQLAFGAYLGALFNLNPLLDRDGYQILVDVLRQPDLRRRALEQLRRRLAGQGRTTDSRLLQRYGLLALCWMVASVGFAIAMSLRYERVLAAQVPGPAAWALLAPIWAALLVLPLGLIVQPLRARRRRLAA
jgi:putative peptide zinc metalloprotease protein